MMLIPSTKSTLDQYNTLKLTTIHAVNTSHNAMEILNKLKLRYQNDIDSRRRFEDIQNLEKLFLVLEIRNCLCPAKIDPLKEISHELSHEKSSTLNKTILDYERSKKSEENFMRCVPLRDHTISGRPISISTVLSNRTKIYDLLRRRTGTNYRSLGRNLNLQEVELEAIDLRTASHDFPAKIDEILHVFESRCDRGKWLLELRNALEKTRRKDLSNEINEIWSAR